MKKIIIIFMLIILSSFCYSLELLKENKIEPIFEDNVKLNINTKISIELINTDLNNKQNIKYEINKLDSNIYKYKDVMQNTDIEYIKLNKKIKERIIINSKPDYKEIKFIIELKDYNYKITNEKEIYILDGDMGIGSFSRPFIEETGEFIPYSYNGYEYILDISKIDWDSLTFPVVIDPTYDEWDSSINISKWGRVKAIGANDIISWSETNEYIEGYVSYSGSLTAGYIYSLKNWSDLPYIINFYGTFEDDAGADTQTSYYLKLGSTTIWSDSGETPENTGYVGGTINLVDLNNVQVNFSSCSLATCTDNNYDLSSSNNLTFIFGGNIGSGGNPQSGNFRLYYLNYTVEYNTMRDATLEGEGGIEPILDDLNIIGYCNATNYYNEDLSYNWEVYKNSVLFDSGITSNYSSGLKVKVINISSDNTSNSDIFYLRCYVTSNESNINSSWYTSNTINIGESYLYDCSENIISNSAIAFNLTIQDEITKNNLLTNATYQINYDGKVLSNTSNKTTYSFCKYPSWIDLNSDFSFYLTKAGYNYLNFKRYDVSLNGTSYLGYMLSSNINHQLISYKIIGSDSVPIESATMSIFRSYGGLPTLIYKDVTDITGTINLYQDSTYLYTYNILTNSYPEKTFTLQPSEQVSEPDYTIKLTQLNNSYFSNAYSNIRYKHIPEDIIFNNTNEWIDLSFVVEGIELTEVGINFTSHDYECIPESCSDVITSSTGGIVTVSIFMNQTGSLDGAYWFMKEGDNTKYYVNDNKIKVVNFVDKLGKSLVDLIIELKENTSPNVRTILATIVSLIFISFGASLGLFGGLLILPAVLANIALSLPMVGLINPFVGMIMSIFGIGMYLLFSMERGV